MKRLSLEEFHNIYSKVPRLCVDVLVKNEKNEILLTKRAIPQCKGYWHIPGGTVLVGETLEDAVKRVSKTELGLKVEVIRIAEKTVEFVLSKNTAGKHAVSIPFFVSLKKNNQKITLNDEATDYGYFSKIPPKTIEEQKKILRDILK